MSETYHLNLPFIVAAQSQKHVTHNEALVALDALIQIGVKSQQAASPPEMVQEGERHIIAEQASGDWLGKEGYIAAFQDNMWQFYQPVEGWLAWSEEDEALYVFHSGSWQDIGGNGQNGSYNMIPFIGVNAVADAQNRLLVSAPNSLFSHAGSDHRIKVNKAAASDTASLLFQDGFSGRAEMGLTGDDDFRIKVSDDGSTWKESMVVDGQSGAVDFPQNSLTQNMIFNLFKDGGRFAGSPEPTSVVASAFTPPSYLSPYNGGVFSSYDKFKHNNSTYGGSGDALDPVVADLIEIMKTGEINRRYGPEFYVMKHVAGTSTNSAKTVEGITRYLAWVNNSAPLWFRSTWGMNLRCLSGSISLDLTPSLFDLYQDGQKQSGDDPTVSSADGWTQFAWKGVTSPSAAYDYNNTLFKVRATPGAEILIALPFLFPGQITPKPGEFFGRVSSLEAWR